MVENKLIRWFVYEWRKPTRQKPHRVILRSPLPRIHYYHNKRLQVKKSQYLIPTYSWTLTLIPNWTCSVVTISHFQCTASNMWLTNLMCGSQYVAYSPTWERCWLQSSSVHYTMKITKLLGYKTLRCTNTTDFSRERWTRVNSVSGHNLHEHNFSSHLRNLWRTLKKSLYMLGLREKKAQTCIHKLKWNQF